jgi:hypothetical protein
LEQLLVPSRCTTGEDIAAGRNEAVDRGEGNGRYFSTIEMVIIAM